MVATPTQATGTAASAAAPLQVKTTISEERLTEEQLKARGFTTRCEFETDFAPNLLTGAMFVLVSEVDEPFQPTRIIDSNEDWLIDIVWFLQGKAVSLLCGREWRLKIFMESMGKDNLDLEIPLSVPVNANQFYFIQLRIPGDFVKVEPGDGTPFNINVATTLLDNNGRTSPIVGFCSLDTILFFREEDEV